MLRHTPFFPTRPSSANNRHPDIEIRIGLLYKNNLLSDPHFSSRLKELNAGKWPPLQVVSLTTPPTSYRAIFTVRPYPVLILTVHFVIRPNQHPI